MISLKERVDQAEIMDDASVGYEEFSQTLRQLELVNHLVSAYRPTLEALTFFWKEKHHGSSAPFKILDIGCGYGDALRKIHHWAKRRGVTVELTGIDLSPWSKQAASAATPTSMGIQYLTQDIFDFKPENPYHVIINSLFTHHLSDADVIRVMQWMTQHAVYGWFINDLHRQRLPYYFIKYFVKACRFNRLIKNDAPLSVARSFVRQDWEKLLAAAKLDTRKVQVMRYWPYRWGIRYVV
jgi:2-polyprenyl-3-methyl-5-hydroxy-6-metoxy-1,4-benzoquinol methylase